MGQQQRTQELERELATVFAHVPGGTRATAEGGRERWGVEEREGGEREREGGRERVRGGGGGGVLWDTWNGMHKDFNLARQFECVGGFQVCGSVWAGSKP
jgi:hypothetical protein